EPAPESHKEIDPVKAIEYVRRLDRTPEKDFNARNEEDKKMVCQRRLLTEKVKEKIDRLENEVEAREREVESERKLREAAEQQLETCYRDMYGSPTVNEELRERLPRANKSDPFKREELSETDLSSIEEQIVATDEEGAETRQRF
ncbi:hypothetical protein MAR_001994, partial [Mya arenaria]